MEINQETKNNMINEESSSTEIILYDVLDLILNNLNIYDLNRAATVCK